MSMSREHSTNKRQQFPIFSLKLPLRTDL